VLNGQRGRGRSRIDVTRIAAGRLDIGRAEFLRPGRRRQHGRRDRQGWRMIRCLRKRMTVLLASGLVGRVGGLTARHGRHGVGCRRTAVLDRTDIGRHRQLLEQQTEQRDERNPASVAMAE